MQDIYIVAAGRSAIGAFQGDLASVPASELGSQIIRQLLNNAGIKPAHQHSTTQR
jgi:acetyl-CoA acetyltransferase (EC 2.3.1.9)